jgi:hypothetical protein
MTTSTRSGWGRVKNIWAEDTITEDISAAADTFLCSMTDRKNGVRAEKNESTGDDPERERCNE